MKLTAKVLIITTLFTLVLSCRKQNSGESIINDFKTIASHFEKPPAEYTSVPFFVWNGEITREEIERNLRSFKDAGSLQVFIHPRPGLITEYLSDEWFDLFQFTIEKGKELGMKIWIYDENSYPSGFAGGHVPDLMPESYNQGQGLRMIRTGMLPDTCNKFLLCLKEENGKWSDITPVMDQEIGKTGSYLLFAKTFNAKSDWYGGFSYVDLLYPGVTQNLLKLPCRAMRGALVKNLGTLSPEHSPTNHISTLPGGSDGHLTCLTSSGPNGIMI
jgi:hypothetical protein